MYAKCLFFLVFFASCVNATPPNIVVIMTDDQRWDTVTNEVMPHVTSQWKTAGVTFTNAFVNTALCCPSRMSFLTGDRAGIHKVKTNTSEDASIVPAMNTLATRLNNAGYCTGLFGKYINGYSNLAGPPNAAPWYVPPGWDVWAAHIQEAHTYLGYTLVTGPSTFTIAGFLDTDYSVDVLAQHAATFINTCGSAPYFAYVTPTAPHPGNNRVPTRYAGLFAGIAPWRPASWNESNISDKASAMQGVTTMTPENIAAQDAERIAQLESLRAVDDMAATIKAVVDSLDPTNTILVFTSDNGVNWGEHRLRKRIDTDPDVEALKFTKNMPYDEAHRVPLIIVYPAKFGAQVRSDLVTLCDVTATLAEWAGVGPLGTAGISFAQKLPQGLPFSRSQVVFEGWKIDGTLFYRAQRSWFTKTIVWATGEVESYDLVSDPYEMSGVLQ